MSEKFCLRWNDFQSIVSHSFQTLREEKDFYDVTLVADDEVQIPAHKLVLSASSHFFKSILRRNSHSHPLLYLSGVDSQSLGFVLDYVYQGEVQIYQDDLNSFLDVAQKLKIEGLLSNGDTKSDDSFTGKRQELDTKHKTHEYIDNDSKDLKDIIIDDQVPRKIVNLKSSHNRIVSTGKSMALSEADDKLNEFIDRRDGINYCKVCDYKSNRIFNIKEHVEIHIEGLSYSCQFCDKTFRSKNAHRHHNTRYHN